MSFSPTARLRSRASLAVLAVLALGLLALAACARQGAQSRPPEAGDKAVATIGGQTVWASDVKREAVTQGLIGEGEPLDISSQTFHEVLDEVIDQKLLAAEALKLKLDKDPLVRRRLAAARERILGDALIDREADAVVSENAIQALYDEQVRLSGQTEEFHARQIVTATPADADAVKKQLAGGAAFDAVASQRSIDAASRFNGGDLGYVAADSMPQAYAAVLAKAKPGDIVGPFKSDAGWVILKLEDRRPEKPLSIDEARPQIVRFLHMSEVRDILERLRQKTPPKFLIGPAAAGSEALREPASAPPDTGQSAPSAAPPIAVPPPPTPPPPPPTPVAPPSNVYIPPAPHTAPKFPARRSKPPPHPAPVPRRLFGNLPPVAPDADTPPSQTNAPAPANTTETSP